MDDAAFRKIMETAIASEVEAHNFYADAAARVDNAGVKAILEELARDEKSHEKLLSKMRDDTSLVVSFNPPEDWGVAESVEELPALSTSLSPAEAFGLAMKKEQQAVDGYTRLAGWSDDAALRDTWLNLANMERGHKHRLEKLFVEVAYPEAF